MKKFLKTVLIVIVLGLVVYFVLNYSPADKKLKINYPTTYNVSEQVSWGCESLIDANIIGSKLEYLTGGIEGELNKGTDKLGISIKDDGTMTFLTKAALEIGTTEGDSFVIMENTEKLLTAVLYNKLSSQFNTFSLNKENGLAVWTKGQPDFMTYGSPYGQVVYLICR